MKSQSAWNGLLLVSLVLLPFSASRAGEEKEKLPVQFSDQLLLGSAVGAGVDSTAPGEVIHPATSNQLAVSIRSLGDILKSGEGAVAVQAMPYFLHSSTATTYETAAKKREETRTRLYQDTALTLAASSGLPFTADEETSKRFSTLGMGISTELLGNRSIYSAAYSECVKTATNAARDSFYNRIKTGGASASKPPVLPTREPDKTDEAYAIALLKYLAEVEQHRERSETDTIELEASKQTAEALVAEMDATFKNAMRKCTQDSIKSTSALFASAGARWVLPNLRQQEGDSYFIQREYLALTGEFYPVASVSLAVQGRFLGDRTAPVPFKYTGDIGLSLTYGGSNAQWSLDATQAVFKPSGAPDSGTFAGMLKVRAASNFFVSVGVRGQGRDVGEAFGRSAVTLGLTYEEQPLFSKTYTPDT